MKEILRPEHGGWWVKSDGKDGQTVPGGRGEECSWRWRPEAANWNQMREGGWAGWIWNGRDKEGRSLRWKFRYPYVLCSFPTLLVYLNSLPVHILYFFILLPMPSLAKHLHLPYCHIWFYLLTHLTWVTPLLSAHISTCSYCTLHLDPSVTYLPPSLPLTSLYWLSSL